MLHPTSTTRRTGRQLAILLLSLVSACSVLFGAAAPKAEAETTQRFTTIDWHMDDYIAPPNSDRAANNRDDYNDMVNALRNAAGHQMEGVSNSPGYMDTPTRTNTNRIIRVLIWTHTAVGPRANLALYFNVDNLYMLGFSSNGFHYRFVTGNPATEFTNHLPEELRLGLHSATPLFFTPIRGDGSYAQMSAPAEWRANQEYTASMLYQREQILDNFRPERPVTSTVTQAMAYFIGATAEAARFGWIQNRIAQTIYRGGDTAEPGSPANIGPFGTDLETNWGALSRMAHNTAAHRVDPGVTINNRTYYNVNDLGNNVGFRPRLTPFLALYGSGR
ncbi:ribosome-inactivating family protein [Streptomyces vinaceus]|uniref:ribosome-inactivating family protein n=1 Tax=Streptomyces vinaceus TaxID=1960 RepID=UPI003807C406